MLKEHGEFYPYGGHMTSDGKITHVGGKADENDHPASQPIIDLLEGSFRRLARTAELKATSIIFDVRVQPPGSIEKTDAIVVCLDHREGYSVKVVLPYRIAGGELLFGQNVAQRGIDTLVRLHQFRATDLRRGRRPGPARPFVGLGQADHVS